MDAVLLSVVAFSEKSSEDEAINFNEVTLEQFNIQMGEELTVSFDIDARQWQDRWFNSIRAWKVERVSAATATPTPGAPVPPPAPSAAPEFLSGDAKDDLPF